MSIPRVDGLSTDPRVLGLHNQVLLYDSKLHLFPGKLKSRWTGPFIIHQAYPNGSVDLLNPKDNRVFKVNGQRVKPYAAQHIENEDEISLLDPL